MFKTLITTCLLTFSCSSGALPREKDLNVRQMQNSTSIYGSYCLRDEFSNLDYTGDTAWSYTVFTSDSYDWNLQPEFTTDGVTWKPFLSFSIAYDRVLSSPYLYSINFVDLNNQTTSVFIPNGYDITDLNSNVRGLTVYFRNQFYITGTYSDVFSNIFTNSGNQYVNSYTGWYTLTNFSYNTEYRLYGNIIVDNNLYDEFYYDYGTGYSRLLAQDRYNVIDGGRLVAKSNAIYLSNVLIPVSIYTQMANMGVFDYVVEPVQYTFGDMIFNVVDAPIYMLSQLFSFELFGIQFYVAFMGIVTVILIGFIVRKLI